MKLDVASPCKRDWSKMTGTDAVRFCGDCRMNVYNLSALTQSELEKLVNEKEGRVCVRFFSRPDGTVLTRDCPVGVARKRRTYAVSLAAIGALLVAPFVTQGERCSSEEPTLVDSARELARAALVKLGFTKPAPPSVKMGKMVALPPPPPPAP